MLQQIITFIHLLLALSLIGLVLVQHGKGADAGAAFGSGASGTVFGSSGSGNFLTRLTITLALLLAVTSVSLTLLANRGSKATTLSEEILQQDGLMQQEPVAPAAPEVPQ